MTIDGEMQLVPPVSTGATGYDTPSGASRPFWMEVDHYSKECDDTPMPHSISFTGEGHAIHGSFQIKTWEHAHRITAFASLQTMPASSPP
ncbi:MAG: hypothetical protein HY245_08060 [Rhizobiales bacterium]|nr:hypothetical protein [Hyphomicrobiales bacterium]MBI3673359.1 hypothetical protein [Hyphomicrobiales bacterium]